MQRIKSLMELTDEIFLSADLDKIEAAASKKSLTDEIFLSADLDKIEAAASKKSITDEIFLSADLDKIEAEASKKSLGTNGMIESLSYNNNQVTSSPDLQYSNQLNEELLLQTVDQYFGFKEIRKGQVEVIQSIMNNRDTFVLWATGQGKSLCYQLPPLLTGKISIIVSPLISLMNDQVIQFNNKIGNNQEGFPAACFLGSAQTDSLVEIDAVAGKYRLVYLTPEKLCSDGFVQSLIPLQQRYT